MAGKRPDQYNIDPSEAGATDYDRLPQSGHGGEFKTPEGDKQRLAQSREDAQGQPFPPDVPAPSAHAKRGDKLDPEQMSDEELRARDREEGK